MPGRSNEEFGYGTDGGPQIATSMQQNVDPAFRPEGVLSAYQNVPSGTGQDPRVTGMYNTKTYGITGQAPGGQPGSQVMNV